MILNHVSLGTNNLTLAIKFYDAVLAPLGIARTHTIENEAAAYGEQFEFWIGCSCTSQAASSGNGTHIAFNAPSRKAVDAFHSMAIEFGGKCEGPAGTRPEYGEGYYAAYVRDLDGNKIEAVCLG